MNGLDNLQRKNFLPPKLLYNIYFKSHKTKGTIIEGKGISPRIHSTFNRQKTKKNLK